jgi:GntR family transcriptional regulator/MocR family aminotransferase
LREAIADGRLRAGTRLPSSRSLAGELGVARNTVVDAYGQLTAEGWLDARRGSGTAVADRPAEAVGVAAVTSDRPRQWRYDLRPGGPDLSSFPRSAWLAASRRVLSYAPNADFGYGDAQGTRQLREALAGYLGRVRGVRTHPSRVVICTGFTQAIGLLCQVLREGGAATLAIECYALPELRQIATRRDLDVVTVPVDEQGADLASAGAAEAAVITPAHQFPLGAVLSSNRRRAALAWARRESALIVEDDYDGEFRYDREPLGALQGLDAERVVYVGTASKTLAPALRLAWLALPSELVQPVVEAKLLADRHTAVIEQLTLAEFIRSGAYDRHVRRRRLAYRQRRDHLVDSLGTSRVEGISAGLHALVDLPAGMTEAEAVATAGARGLALEGLDAYRTGQATRAPAVVVGYATPPDHAYRAAVTLLRDVVATPNAS